MLIVSGSNFLANETNLASSGSEDRAAAKPDFAFESLRSYLDRTWLRCLMLLLFGAAVRVPAIQGELIWDDQFLAHDSPFIKSPLLTLEAFRHYLFPDSFAGHYRPVQNISYILDYFVWNSDTTYGFHVSNILWHVASGILLYFLLQRLLVSLTRGTAVSKGAATLNKRGARLRSTLSFVLALLWVVHPVHSAAIDYISGRADSLAFVFSAGAWLLYLRGRGINRTGLRRSCFIAAALSAVLALGSRESGFMWMTVFLLHVFLFEKHLSLRRKLHVVAVCVCITVVYFGLRQLPESRPDSAPVAAWPAPVRATLMLRALGDYGRLLIYPGNLHMERTVFEPGTFRNHESWRGAASIEYLSIAGLGVLAVFVAGGLWRGRGQHARVFGAGWFLLTYLPISNLVSLNATVAEHWLYLPSVGFFIFIGGVLFDLPVQYHRLAAGFALVALIGFSARSAARSSDWTTAETFFERTLAAGGSSSRAGVNLALIHSRRGDYVGAERLLRKVLQISPVYPLARNNLADAVARQGRTEEAQAMLNAARDEANNQRKDYTRTWIASFNLARLLHGQKDDTAAVALMEKVRAEYPGTWDLISFEAELLRSTQGPGAALGIVEEFARNNWWHRGAALALGRLHSERGDAAQAEAFFRKASWLDVHDVEALNLITLLKIRQNRLDDAFQTQRGAIARQPTQPRQYLMLADILQKMGRVDEANTTLAQAVRLQAIVTPAVAAN